MLSVCWCKAQTFTHLLHALMCLAVHELHSFLVHKSVKYRMHCTHCVGHCSEGMQTINHKHFINPHLILSISDTQVGHIFIFSPCLGWFKRNMV